MSFERVKEIMDNIHNEIETISPQLEKLMDRCPKWKFFKTDWFEGSDLSEEEKQLALKLDKRLEELYDEQERPPGLTNEEVDAYYFNQEKMEVLEHLNDLYENEDSDLFSIECSRKVMREVLKEWMTTGVKKMY